MAVSFETWESLDVEDQSASKASAKEKSDLEPWKTNVVQPTLKGLPQGYNLRAEDFGMPDGVASMIEGALRGSDVEKNMCRLALDNALWYMLNLMRLDSGLDIDTREIKDWDSRSLEEGMWGNEAIPSKGKGSTSPKAGWWYRMVEANWATVAKVLGFWNPERNLDVTDRAVEKMLNHAKRKRALEMLEAVKKKLASKHKESLAKSEERLNELDFDSMSSAQLEAVDRSKLGRLEKSAHTRALKKAKNDEDAAKAAADVSLTI